jgi:hypothetical protein
MGGPTSDMWLYQMSETYWPAAQFRATVWEGETIYWPTGRVRSEDRPQPGDRLLCWYAPTGASLPGVVGWGVVLGYSSDREELIWRPAPPTDALKMHPLFNDDVVKRVDGIRGGFRQATMWPMSTDDAAWFGDMMRLSTAQ